MSNPLPYLVRMLLFLAVVAGIAYLLHHDLLRVFLNTPILNSVIVGVLVIGIFFVMRQVISLWPEVRWLRRFQHREPGAPPLETDSIDLLAPMAAMLGERQDNFRLSPTATRAMLDGIASRLDERRELTPLHDRPADLPRPARHLLGPAGDDRRRRRRHRRHAGHRRRRRADVRQAEGQGIDGPLKGMSTAFGASLFGLSGSLVLGFLELQASQAQGRFHIELEEWLAGATRLSSGNLRSRANRACSAYVEALLERTADGLDDLTRTLRRSEESREADGHRQCHAGRASGRPDRDHARRSRPCSPAWPSSPSSCAARSIACPSGSPRRDREALLAHQRNIEATSPA